MSKSVNKSLAIACYSGSFKGAFIHGVLSAFEIAGLRANAYAAASSSVIPCSMAAIGRVIDVGANYWQKLAQLLKQDNIGMSQIVIQSIADFAPVICEQLFQTESPELFIATSAVITAEATAETQSTKAKRLGRQLLVSTAKKDKSWIDKNLRLALFGSANYSSRFHMNASNFKEVAYASTRMLHGWDIPAWIADKPYVDASYTCLCPALEMVDIGYKEVIAIANEPGLLYRDICQIEPLPNVWKNTSIRTIQPDLDPKILGVDFTSATAEGLMSLYRHGEEKGREFLNNSKRAS
ncbi:MAG: hypothetical protein JGK17_08160 [Microcoleus sp. PH2017_10_PVI_O_A]|uniref:hypothetical protein n=1 Tax=unclassified Microcoleus TaxID=2642155 RepID=UPI001D813678|nr:MULTISPECIES: hypothetical protein [unclassified Microcoleus]TAE83585.1 MAG: hypothetical protein EAZ83_08730 [Oscillatoriales cyanobacterium]MCC3405553.1 hypothetical protein [Microcoleus sp. PH2017_10_PVI_O_A]MCC3459528.1 hypothetical protein [Microcoleus sp. PH2017_11_PCY_U_A]MCC3477993.1 hypothetical protein [Microcoleus sp. PH2017_12_PCY_D_A]MCC3526613.1 hypothetical protein [Microcoleus sp. PH2017_21_RUC_O_A]